MLPLPSIQHSFFHWHWIKSKSRSLWNEVGLVRTFRIQSQHSRDFQVSNMPKSPSILVNLERTDKSKRAQSHSTPPQSYFRTTSRSRCWPRSTSRMICELGTAAKPSHRRFPDQTTVNLHGRWGRALMPHRALNNKAVASLLCESNSALLIKYQSHLKKPKPNPLKDLRPFPAPPAYFLVSPRILAGIYSTYLYDSHHTQEHRISHLE